MPKTGSFYIINSVIIFNTISNGLGHPFFWSEIVKTFFKGLDFQTYKELSNSCYATDRGRVTKDNETGKLTLYGTPQCKKYLSALKKIFKLTKDVKIVLKDEHYNLVQGDSDILKDCIPFSQLPKKGVIRYIEGGIFEKG